MPELERWVLHRLYTLDREIRKWTDTFDFHLIFSSLHNFCAVELSAFYFDIRKDTLYCESVDSNSRRSARTVLDKLFCCLTAWLAPILCFTSEEAWIARYSDSAESVHFRDFPNIPEEWQNRELSDRWEKIREIRKVVTGALELERSEKRIGSSLEAKPLIHHENVMFPFGVKIIEGFNALIGRKRGHRWWWQGFAQLPRAHRTRIAVLRQ